MTPTHSASLAARDLVLVGAGHTNLHVVRMWRMQPIADVQLTLIDPYSRATYSGMLPGTLAGLYRPGDMEIDLWRFCESCGVRLIVAEAIGLEPQQNRVLLADRPPVRYDAASIGIGSVPGQRELWSGRRHVLAIKPMSTFRQRFQEVLDGLLENDRVAAVSDLPASDVPHGPRSSRTRTGGKIRVAVVGAGAGGVEVAFGLDASLRRSGIDAEVTIVEAHTEILRGYSAGTVRRAQAECTRRGIALRLGRKVVAIDDQARIVLDDGSSLTVDVVIWATAASPPPVLATFALPKTNDGFLAVRPTLQTTADFPVFAVGDSASFEQAPVPKAGVFAVREGPVLWDNIQRLFAGRELRPYLPQRGFLSLLSTGDGRAIADYKGFSTHSAWAFRWKDHIDRKFMRMYQDYRPYQAMSRPESLKSARWLGRIGRSASDAQTAAMRCTGCGSKVGANVLRAALERLERPADSQSPPGHEAPDDAALLDRHTSPVDALSVDFFPAFLDEPYLVGRIAALHALSDLWAMGSAPLGAMALVTLPAGSPAQQTELLYQLLAGGLAELTQSGTALWGGHTTEGPELTVGYTVAGKLDDRLPLKKGNLRPGDRLILTKPLGTATLLAAHRESRCEARWMDAMLASMLESNAAAARIAREFGVTALTDVTGFGLVGHLLEMLDASGVSACISPATIPLLAGFAELCAAGYRSSLAPANREAESRMRLPHVDLSALAGYHSLFDPQTSGGLLIGVEAEQASGLCRRLRAEGCPSAAVIGQVLSYVDVPVVAISG